MARHIMTLTCDDRPGIVATVSTALVRVSANIVENQQYSDASTDLFFMRTVFDADEAGVAAVVAAVNASPAITHEHLSVRPEAQHCRTLILVSKFDHCLLDLLYRWKSGDLPIDIAGVVSNHEDCRLEGRAINIHHSFLPGFKGARPYHQAHDRGVKLIGASAHYVTADLDEGPIIEQDVVRVTHAETPERLVALGRDVERRVLSRAVRDHAENRVFLSGRRTIVF